MVAAFTEMMKPEPCKRQKSIISAKKSLNHPEPLSHVTLNPKPQTTQRTPNKKTPDTPEIEGPMKESKYDEEIQLWTVCRCWSSLALRALGLTT